MMISVEAIGLMRYSRRVKSVQISGIEEAKDRVGQLVVNVKLLACDDSQLAPNRHSYCQQDPE